MSATTVVTNLESPIQFKLAKNIKQAIQSQGCYLIKSLRL